VIVAAGALIVGLSIGLVGIGGVFLIPILVAAGRTLEEAIGTSLLTFTVTGIVATAIYARRGGIDWRLAAYTSAGSIIGGPVGARLSVALPPAVVSSCFAAFLIVTGVSALRRRPATSTKASCAGPLAMSSRSLFGCGVAVGIGSGLTGVGGPALLVPMLLLLNVPASIAIGISQPNQIAASASGAAGHLIFGHVDIRLAAELSVAAGIGVVVGAWAHARIGAAALRRAVATACIALGSWTIGEIVRKAEGR